MSDVQIKDLEELLGLDAKNKKIICQKINRLTAPGENYGSVMYAVDVLVKTPDGTEEISAVAKAVPPNKFIQKIFRTHKTFKIEIYFYKTIIPLLQDFQREHGVKDVVDFTAKFLGGRVSDKEIVDNDAALVLENLKLENYTNLDRFRGVDVDAAKLIIKDLAYLHAVPIALKMKKPEVFERQIKPYLVSNRLNANDEKTRRPFHIRNFKSMSAIEDCVPYLERIQKALEKPLFAPSRELFSTISHNDCWVNNTMVKLENGKPVKSKIVDFQIVDYASLARDLIFFMFTSITNEILQQSYDDLIQFYYGTFISVLKELKCDVTQFTFEAFLEEIDYEARNSEFSHCTGMVMPILQPKGAVEELSEEFLEKMLYSEPTSLQKEKYAFIVKEFAKRKWI